MFTWDTTPATSPFGNVLTPLPESGIVDFTNPAAHAWWRDAHQRLFDAGVDVIKSDFGEQVPEDAVAYNGDRGRRLHNVYPLLYNRCVYEATRKFARPENGAPIVWSRAAWSGQQRYPLGWGGDPQSDWEGLAASIRGGLSWGMSGNPYHSSDIGGFYGAEQPGSELFVRWLQASVFSSHMRLHGIGEREPWAFGPEAEAIARKWLAFRYRLIPYLEQTIRTATRTGLPVMRAMPLAFPANPLTRRYDTQFLFGDALLVAPVVQEGGEVEIALPPGGWYDLNSRARYAGRQVLRYKAGLDQFPVFGREGYALPLGPSVQHTGEIPAEKPIDQLWVFGKPAIPLDSNAGPDHDCRRGRTGGSRRRRCTGAFLRRRAAGRYAMNRGPRANPDIAVTSGEPAGIGPELCAMLAARHSVKPFAARLVILGDRELLDARAKRIGVDARYVRYDPAAHAPAAGAVEVWHRPAGRASGARPARPDERADDPRHAARWRRRLRDRRARCARHGARAEERDPGRRDSVHRSYRIPRRSHGDSARGDDARGRESRGAVARRAGDDASAGSPTCRRRLPTTPSKRR